MRREGGWASGLLSWKGWWGKEGGGLGEWSCFEGLGMGGLSEWV